MADRIYVKTDQFEGWAAVTDYFPNELFPIQIVLDKPDEHGHAIKRVCKADIIQKEGVQCLYK